MGRLRLPLERRFSQRQRMHRSPDLGGRAACSDAIPGCRLRPQRAGVDPAGRNRDRVELLRSSLATLAAERYELYATELNGSLAQGFAMMGRLDQALLTINKTIAQL